MLYVKSAPIVTLYRSLHSSSAMSVSESTMFFCQKQFSYKARYSLYDFSAVYLADKFLNCVTVFQGECRLGDVVVGQGERDAAFVQYLVACPVHRPVFGRSFFRTP